MEKQINDNIRIKTLQDEKSAKVNKKIEIAMKGMIEKEKYYEAIANINKYPESMLRNKLKPILE